jgi:hypothetical protein
MGVPDKTQLIALTERATAGSTMQFVSPAPDQVGGRKP